MNKYDDLNCSSVVKGFSFVQQMNKYKQISFGYYFKNLL